jgi:hypothetical protein
MPDGLPSLPFGSRLDKVGKAFDFEEIELAIAECPPRKLSRLCRPQARRGLQLLEQGAHHGRTGVDMKLRHIFAGERCRGRKPQDQASVKQGAVSGAFDFAKRREPGTRQ